MTLWYKVLYQLGFTPWEEDPAAGPAAEQISTLFDREEKGSQPPYGPVLDLGCGSGIWSVRLAERGWQVTGVDVVPKAIRQGRERAKAAGVEVQFVEGDVTALRAAGVGSGFRFVLDFECFNLSGSDSPKLASKEMYFPYRYSAACCGVVHCLGRSETLPGKSRRFA